jgi:hypothetical protein
MSRSHHCTRDFADGPPPEVLDEIDAAWERAVALLAGEVRLHFHCDVLLDRALAELRTLNGTVAHRVSPSIAVAIACGDLDAPTALASVV